MGQQGDDVSPDAQNPRKRTPTRPPPPSAEMPRRLGPYRLCMEIGAGGMSTVYLARVEYGSTIRRFVALKRLRPHLLEQPTLAEMFYDEANIASHVHHPNVCSVLDFDASPHAQYLAMEYLMGEPLSAVRDALHRDRQRLGPGPRADLMARVIADAAEGLHATHEACDLSGKRLEVVHRDISPDNIFLTYDGTAKIVDFGVACASGQKHETRTGVVKGKLAYLPPEVLTGKRPDRRADIWALGVVFWEMLTLMRLFRRENDVATFTAIKECKVPPPSQFCPGLPDDFDAIVMRALACDPSERFATARELGCSLNRALVRRGSAVSTPDVAVAMDALFPEGRAHKRQLLEAAAEIDDGDAQQALPPEAAAQVSAPEVSRSSAPEISRGSAPEVSGSSVPESSRSSAHPAKPAATMTASGGTEIDTHILFPKLRGQLRLRMPQALGLTALLALSTTAWLGYQSLSGPDAPAATRAPAPTVAAAAASYDESPVCASAEPAAAPVVAASAPAALPTAMVLERGTYMLEVTGDGTLKIVRIDTAPSNATALPDAALLARLAAAPKVTRPKKAPARSFWLYRPLALAAVKR
jgi:serine/threonine protein kinase